MERITGITLALIALFVTAAIAQQASMGWENPGNWGRGQHADYRGSCPMMNGSMSGPGMMGPGMQGATTPTSNWRTNPAYLGRLNTETAGR